MWEYVYCPVAGIETSILTVDEESPMYLVPKLKM
jgi:hypothetical protein